MIKRLLEFVDETKRREKHQQKAGAMRSAERKNTQSTNETNK